MWVLTFPKQGSELNRAKVTKVHEQAFSAFLLPGPGRSLTHRGTGTLKSAPRVPILPFRALGGHSVFPAGEWVSLGFSGRRQRIGQLPAIGIF